MYVVRSWHAVLFCFFHVEGLYTEAIIVICLFSKKKFNLVDCYLLFLWGLAGGGGCSVHVCTSIKIAMHGACRLHMYVKNKHTCHCAHVKANPSCMMYSRPAHNLVKVKENSYARCKRDGKKGHAYVHKFRHAPLFSCLFLLIEFLPKKAYRTIFPLK